MFAIVNSQHFVNSQYLVKYLRKKSKIITTSEIQVNLL